MVEGIELAQHDAKAAWGCHTELDFPFMAVAKVLHSIFEAQRMVNYCYNS